jgi:hypothetical protein
MPSRGVASAAFATIPRRQRGCGVRLERAERDSGNAAEKHPLDDVVDRPVPRLQALADAADRVDVLENAIERVRVIADLIWRRAARMICQLCKSACDYCATGTEHAHFHWTLLAQIHYACAFRYERSDRDTGRFRGIYCPCSD